MSGEPENLGRLIPEISDEDRLRFERLDFDAVRQSVSEAFSPILHNAITKRFGINKVIITGDDSGEWDMDREYSETILWKSEREHDDKGVDKLFVISPGYGAIDRYSDAIDRYLVAQSDGESRFLRKTNAFEMYAAGLTVNIFFDAALTEVEGQEYPDAILKMNTILDTLGNSTNITNSIIKIRFYR